jgi:hypothetical protein
MKIFSPQITGSLQVDGNSTLTGSLLVSGSTTINTNSGTALQINGRAGTTTLLRLSALNDNSDNFVVTAGDATNSTLTMGNGVGFGQITFGGNGANSIQSSVNLAITAPTCSISGLARVTGPLTVGGGALITGSLTVSGSSTFLQSTVLSGSIRGEVNALSIASNTASLDCALDNFFTLQLVSGSNTFINPSNILPGQTINLRINTTGSATVSFPSSVLQVSGSSYVPTTTTGVDVVTFISFDSTSLLLSNVKNLV